MTRPRHRILLAILGSSLFVLIAPSSPVRAQDLLNDNPQYSPFNLELRPFVMLPANDRSIIGMTTRKGDARLYVATEGGRIYTINPDGSGGVTPAPWFDLAGAEAALG